jgi:HAD superfamily hydrolase (TIGR01509 family)
MLSDFAVGFDFDHTLGIDNKLERTVALDQLAKLAAENGLQYDVLAADAAIDDVLKNARSGDHSIESYIAGFYERFASAGNAIVDFAGKYREVVVENAPSYVQPLPGAVELLAQLDAKRVPYALLTNGWSPLQEEKARLIGFGGPVFVSERIGMLKPSAAAFGQLVKHFEMAPAAIWYVGDDPVADCDGANECGMRSVWFDWEQKTYPDGISAPMHTIHMLEELLALLPCA